MTGWLLDLMLAQISLGKYSVGGRQRVLGQCVAYDEKLSTNGLISMIFLTKRGVR
jgi:hypothetical protein